MRKVSIQKDWLFERPSVQRHLVCVPHDWAAAGPFDVNNDLQYTIILADGEHKKDYHQGRTGGLPHVGTAKYSKTIFIPSSEAGRIFRLEFDGVMSHSSISVNGILLGGRAFGYSSFAVDITRAIRFGEENLIEVNVNNPGSASRWYPGAGIYREVRLLSLDPIHFLYSGIRISNDRTSLRVSAESSQNAQLIVRLLDWAGICIAQSSSATHECTLSLPPNLKLWSPDEPTLYQIECTLNSQGKTTDCILTKYGFREIIFDAKTGMSINGKPFRMNGVCLHHDLGILGAAYSQSAQRYRFEQLKAIGCNAIRTTHNPPAPQLLDLCDEMGFVVIDEAFDVWEIAKIDHDYHIDFPEWHVRDLTDMIRRDRNHPSVIMWSIGNEILEQRAEDGWKTARELSKICHEIDPTRPTTAGFDCPDMAIQHGLPDEVDIPGWNYKPHRYEEFINRYPQKPQYGSETASTVSSRGVYYWPVQEGYLFHRPENQCSSYDVEFPPWASTPEREFHFQDMNPSIMGEFVWTGFDYLGEPTPYKQDWPSYSSYFGIFDLANLPKDRAWLYAARWTNKPVLHLLPHWTWPQMEGKTIPVHAYTNCAKVELFVNGVSQGKRTPVINRAIWEAVPYLPGELSAIGLDSNDNPVEKITIRTAGKAAALSAHPNRHAFLSEDDLIYVAITAIDINGEPVPDCDTRINFEISGPGELAGVGNGDPCSVESFSQNNIRLFHGQAACFLRKTAATGVVTLKIVAPGLQEEILTFNDPE